MHRKSLLTIIVLVIAAAVAVQSQTIPEDEIRWGNRPYVPASPGAVRIQTNMVEVGVVVRDSHGKPVGGLKQSDFEILDEGKPQQISFFSVETAPGAAAPSVETATFPPPPAAPALPPAPKPRYVAMYFDDTSMKQGDISASAKAAGQFIRESAEPGDKIGIFTSSTTVSLNFTEDKQKLLESISQLRSHFNRADRGPGSCPRMTISQAYEITNNYNIHSPALDLAIAEIGVCAKGAIHPEFMARQQAQQTIALAQQFSQDTLGILTDVIRFLSRMPGRRMLLLASSGFWTQTLSSQLDKVTDAALRANVVINSLDAKGLYADTTGTDFTDGPPIVLSRGDYSSLQEQYRHDQVKALNDPMSFLADATGGRFFHNSNDLGRGMREMAAFPEVSYVLGFSPDTAKPDGKVHTLKVKLANPRDVTVEARRSYTAPSPKKEKDNSPLSLLEKLDREVLASGNPAEIAAQVKVEQVPTDPGTMQTGQGVLKVSVHVDISRLPFQKRGDRSVERVIFVTALFDSGNHFLTGVEGIMDLSLKEKTLAQISAQGLDAKLSLQAPPGSYRLRQVIEEIATGRVTSISRSVQIN